MKIELRNVKEMKTMSEETIAFTATVVVDGKVLGQAENSGKGGCNRYSTRELEHALTEYAKTLPQYELGWGLGMRNHDADSALGKLLVAFLGRKDVLKALSTRVLILTKGGRILETKKLKKEDLRRQAEAALLRPDTDKVLNLLPEDEAVEVFFRVVNAK